MQVPVPNATIGQVAVDLLLPDDRRVTVGHGALIGRLRRADVFLADPRISEAHALLTLRGRQLRILALRGKLVIDGQRGVDRRLEAGMTVHLAPGVNLRVLDVRLPTHVLGLRLPGLGTVVLEGDTSIFTEPVRVMPGCSPEASEWVWPREEGWARRGGEPIPVHPGDRWAVGSTTIEAVAVPLEGGPETEAGTGFTTPLTIELYFDTVHLKRRGRDVVVITRASARILTEIALSAVPLSWSDLARQVWSDADEPTLRARWDTQIYRLRRRLRRHGIDPGLVRSDGTGLVELVLRLDDVIVDRT